MIFMNPLDALFPKIPFFLLNPGHLQGPGVSVGRILGGPSIESIDF